MRHEIEAKNGKLIVRCIVSVLSPVFIDGEVRNIGALVDMDDADTRELIASGCACLASSDELQHALHVGVAWHSVKGSISSRARRTKAMRQMSKRIRSTDDFNLQDVRHAAHL